MKMLIGILISCAAGCQVTSFEPRASSPPQPGPTRSKASGGQTSESPSQNAAPSKTLAYLNGRPITPQDVQQALIEANGGQVLSELVLEQMVQQHLALAGHRLSQEHIDAEQRSMTALLNPDPEMAIRLLKELRQRRGLGEDRFRRLLMRNAGLRLLVQNQVEVSDSAIQRAFQLRFGPRYEARLIILASLSKAQAIHRRAHAGESFIDLAIEHSTDSSRAQGGLLPSVSPVDATFPQVIRTELTRLEPGQISSPIWLENGFAILKLERKIDRQPVQLVDVKDQIVGLVQQRVERVLMEQLARTLIREADLIILDAALEASWREQKSRLFQEGS